MGPLLLSRLLGLNETQEGVINIAFTIADDQGMLLLDLKDLRAILNHVGENASDISTTYGYVTKSSIGAILRRLLVLENEGGEAFFGEPALKLEDMIALTPKGQGRINILAAEKLMQSPKLYATFLLWLLSELFEELPEVGDPDKPKFVFFFDEAHLLFEDAPKALIDKVEMVARLIRSKGVGVYFITQNPADVPDDILGQLGNRVQHALRAYTPRDRKALRAAAETFRQNPAFDAVEAIPDLGTGEALVSTLDPDGAPTMVQRTLIRPPSSRLGPLSDAERKEVIQDSPLFGVYDDPIDRKSAFEMLTGRAEAAIPAAAEGGGLTIDFEQFNSARRYVPVNRPEPRAQHIPTGRAAPKEKAAPKRRGSNRQTVAEAAMKSFARSVSSRIGREVVRGVLGGMFRGR
jgi:DNA helicase HerA-like ATPase